MTETLTQTLCPTWDQTLIFKEVDIFDNRKDLEKNPPNVVMEIFDYDKVSMFAHMLHPCCMKGVQVFSCLSIERVEGIYGNS